MNNRSPRPIRHINIETVLDEFVLTFRNGQLIRDLMTTPSKMPPNADYLFAADSVIAELKCLVKNQMEASDWRRRLAKACEATGLDDIEGRLIRGEPLPDAVRARLFHLLREAIRNVVKKGNQQIRASKEVLHEDGGKGVLLVANDNNYGFEPETMSAVISDAVACLGDSHIDAVVYFTPNVFHRIPGFDVAWIIWEPSYRDETDTELSEFVNDMGRRWHDHLQAITAFVERRELPAIDLSSMQLARRLGRDRT
jgi:hypothetical protein